MRYVLGVLESLLALAFLGTAVYRLVIGPWGLFELTVDLVMVIVGLWLGRMAIANLKPKSELNKA